MYYRKNQMANRACNNFKFDGDGDSNKGFPDKKDIVLIIA